MTDKKSKKSSQVLSAHENALLEAFRIGPEIFGGKDRFISWLNRESMPLGRKKPLKLLLSKRAELVLYELWQIEYGNPV